MSKWFNVTVLLLLVFWLSLISVTQLNFVATEHNHNTLLMQHEADLTSIKMHMAAPHAMLPKTPMPPCTAPCKVIPLPPGINPDDLKSREF